MDSLWNDEELTFRLFEDHPCSCVSVLHALASQSLYSVVQCVLSLRCIRWSCCAQIQPIYQVRSCAGHGHGSVHYRMLAVLLILSLSRIHLHIPASHYHRPCEPLHSHVLDAESRCDESQKDSRGPTLAFATLLWQQCTKVFSEQLQSSNLARSYCFSSVHSTKCSSLPCTSCTSLQEQIRPPSLVSSSPTR